MAVLVSDELLKRVIEFHGHLGPFLVLGLKAGLVANSLLGKDCFKTTAIVTTDISPPSSCLVDGVQFVTGCTMGKGNIKLRRSKNSPTILFLKEGKKIQLRLKKNIWDIILNAASEEDSQKLALELLRKPTSELFKVEE
jgi:formylmethanofuran dehydrogenase subunit E